MKITAISVTKWLGAMLVILTLGGCSLLSPVKTVEPNRYVISKLASKSIKKRKHVVTMLVLPIESAPLYNTTQMAYSIVPYQVAYFAKNEWVETPAQMLLPLVVQSLQNSNYYRAIVTSGYAGTYDYALYLQLLNAKDDFTRRPAVFELTVRAQIYRPATGRITATKLFFVEQPLRYNAPYSGVLAANHASAEFLSRLVDFCLRYGR